MTTDPHRPPQAPERLAANGTRAAGPDVPRADGAPLLTQDFAAGSLYALRTAVAAHATRAGVPEPRARDIVLAVHELAANAIRHGAGHGRLLITEHDGTLRCQVTDDGKPPAAPAGTGPETQATAADDCPWPSQHGHGLWVVGQISDHLSVQSGPGGTIAAASFTLPPPQQQEPAQRAPWDRPTAPDQSPSG
jgi:anti-sigma regulatory factor (Ser/Thr protein kinase)